MSEATKKAIRAEITREFNAIMSNKPIVVKVNENGEGSEVVSYQQFREMAFDN